MGNDECRWETRHTRQHDSRNYCSRYTDVMLVSTVKAERSFSAIKHLKNYLCSAKTTERMCDWL